MMVSKNTQDNFSQATLALLVYTILVIVWGAWVRISGSGDGCGESWPLCNESFVPTTGELPTWIEFSHRLSSGLFGIVVMVMLIWGFRLFEKGHPVRKWVTVTAVLTVTEALIGARLVLAGLVGSDASLARAGTMVLHMFNSLLLVGAITWLWEASRGRVFAITRHPAVRVASGLLLLGFIVIASTGALAALSGTLFPSESLWTGVMKDLSSESHILVRLRVGHPLLASLVAIGVVLYGLWYRESADVLVRQRANRLFVLVLVAVGFGYATLFFLSPTWMKLSHLALAHILWIQLLLLVRAVAMGEKNA